MKKHDQVFAREGSHDTWIALHSKFVEKLQFTNFYFKTQKKIEKVQKEIKKKTSKKEKVKTTRIK